MCYIVIPGKMANRETLMSWSEPNDDRVAATQSNIGSAGAPPGSVSTPRYRSVALPTLQVPTYAGDLRQWQEFWDHYSATIHENTELPPIEKFMYLLTYLTGAAKRAIEGTRLADNNYEIAVTTLKERFGRQELLVNEHIDQLLVAREEFQGSGEASGLGVPPEQYTVVLHRVLMRCLPEDLGIMYRQKKKEESTRGTNASAEPTPPEARTHKATDILAFLKIQVEVREEGKQEAASSYTHNSITVPGDMSSPRRSSQGIPSASALAATESLQQRTPCVLCDSRGHSLAECTVDLSADEKRARLLTARCCYKCGMRNHVARFCRVSLNLTCNKCQRRHLTVLCELSRAVTTTAAPAPTVPSGSSGSTSPTVTTASTGATEANTVTLEALEVPEVCAVTSPPLNIEVLELLSARRYDAADMFDSETWHPEDVSILMGSDAYWKVATGKIDRLNEQLTAVETSFGWTAQGSSSHYEATATSALFLSAGGSHQECNESAMWRLDTIGSENRLSKQAGRYQVPLMMQEPGIPAGSDNRQLAARRLNMQLNRFREQPDLLKHFKLDELPNDRDIEPLYKTATTICPSLVSSRTSIVRAEDFSSLNRLLRVTAFVQRFVHNTSRRSPPRSGTLTTLELEEAERYWLRVVQDQYFGAEIRLLEKEKRLPSTSWVLRLAPFLDTNGLLRVGGRLDLLNASPDIRHPILLPAEPKLTTLIVQAAHVRTLHGGIELTLTEHCYDLL
ncbi:hypothetical protein HPB52_009136 [Rhipicephalus sanguineus]|uniref:CCHC-type domain-containing protein n=1 Tax=Rhipicephalus sanguineus TaxID=34632 RepID=A0A9D4PNU7_RHISA|nr:hypothetical protein HPB52_009136 [Rhipicephalus sanguineus]